MRRVGLPFACSLLALAACNALTGVSDLVPCDSCDGDGDGDVPVIVGDGSINGGGDGTASGDARESGTVDAHTDAKTDASADAADDAKVDAGADAAVGCQGAVACERVVFVTSTEYQGNLGDVAGANAKCQARADASTIARIKGRSFEAWVSTSASSVASRLVHGTMPYVRTDGVVVATSWTNLVNGTIDNGIALDELGANIGNANESAWTGTDSKDGVFGGASCNSWATASSGFPGVAGNVGGNGNGWSGNGLDGCGSFNRLYCFER